MYKYTLPEAVHIFRKAIPQGSAFDTSLLKAKSEKTFPPYNFIEYSDEDGEPHKLVCEFAVAGYSKDELEITFSADDRVLKINGSRKVKYPETRKDGKGGDLPANARYLHLGIAARHFFNAFQVQEGYEVGETKLENGILTIELNYIKPKQKEQTVRVITIN